ncbi:hypothetical protein COZ60_02370 [Candidatus Bathyarchaeota archaeon CG_4_8_14_3_um_filter_42_8]|nr:MAG: hypothetical protein COZ60_02370 [Candidatus Bathyarchaeota archaeon CG_4_8_14_3_um_filter_42_8]
MELVEELGLPELTTEQIEELCSITEEAAREYVLSKVPSKRIETLNISVEVEGTKPVTLTVEIDVALSPLMKDFDVQKLVDEAVNEAFTSAKKYLRELKCHSKK